MASHGRLVGMELLTIPEMAEALGVQITRGHQLVRDGQLVAVRGADGVRRVPADFVDDGAIVKGLPGVITLLRDAHYGDDEIVEWLFREDDSLPARLNGGGRTGAVGCMVRPARAWAGASA